MVSTKGYHHAAVSKVSADAKALNKAGGLLKDVRAINAMKMIF